MIRDALSLALGVAVGIAALLCHADGATASALGAIASLGINLMERERAA